MRLLTITKTLKTTMGEVSLVESSSWQTEKKSEKTRLFLRMEEGGRGLGEKLVEMERRMGMQEGRKW